MNNFEISYFYVVQLIFQTKQIKGIFGKVVKEEDCIVARKISVQILRYQYESQNCVDRRISDWSVWDCEWIDDSVDLDTPVLNLEFQWGSWD